MFCHTLFKIKQKIRNYRSNIYQIFTLKYFNLYSETTKNNKSITVQL